MLSIRVLGTFSITGREKKLGPAARQRRPLALLALALAAGARGLSREQALLFLWADSTSRRARNTLNQTLYALRRDLHEPDLFLAGTTLRLNPEVVKSDHWAFEQALSRRDLEAGASEYNGEFLSQFTLAGAPEFERWMEGERQRLAQRYFQAVVTLAERAAERGEHRKAAEWWWTLTAQEPLSAIVARGLMSSLASSGDRTAALTYAKSYRELIAAELGIDVDDSVKQLIAHLESAIAPDVSLVTETQVHRLLDDLSGAERFASKLTDTPPERPAAPPKSAKKPAPPAKPLPTPSPAMENFFLTLVETSADIIYTTDINGCFTYTNGAGSKLLDLPVEQIIGRMFIEFVREDFRHPMIDFYARQVSEKIPVTYYEFPVAPPSGASSWLGQHVQLLYSGDRVVGTLAVARDITLRKRLDRTQHQLSAQDRVTKLINVSAFRVLVDHRIAMSARTGRGFLLVFVSIDNAEEIVRRDGATAADNTVGAVAEGVCASFRKSDVIARVRPDTIVVLAVNSAQASRKLLHDRLVAAVDKAIKGRTGVAKPKLRISATFYDPQLPASVEALLTNVAGLETTLDDANPFD